MYKTFLNYLFSIVLLCILFPGCKSRASGYSIPVNLKGRIASDSVYLNRYEGSKPVKLQAISASSAKMLFSGNKPLQAGMYSMVVPGKCDLAFVISDTLNQAFTISADIGNIQSSLVFDGSPENNAFAGYRQYLDNARKKQSELQTRMKQNSWIADSTKTINATFEKLKTEMVNRSETLLKEFPGSMLALFIQLMKEPQVPEPVVPLMITNRDQYLRDYFYRYLSDHFLDGIDFADPRIVSIPLYEEKLRYYFFQLVETVPEAIEPKIEMVLKKAGAKDEVYKFTVKFLYRMFRESSAPSLVQESVFIAENFILDDPGKWNDEFFTDNVREKVAKARLNPIGTIATDLKLVGSSGKIIRLSDVKAHLIILYFYNPECEACLPITEKLYLTWQKYKNQGVEVFAVYLERKTEVWKQYISGKIPDWINVFDPTGEEQIEKKYDIYAIPMIYLLDQNKKIVAKDVPVEKLEEFIHS